jgi:hypothetical protein
MDDIVVWLYLFNAILLINHEIDSATPHLFHQKRTE